MFNIKGANTEEPSLGKTIKASLSLEGDSLTDVVGVEEASSGRCSIVRSLLEGGIIIASNRKWPENFHVSKVVVAKDIAQGVRGGDR